MTAALKFVYHIQGAHVRVRAFAGPDETHRAYCGGLMFRPEEWERLREIVEPAEQVEIQEED